VVVSIPLRPPVKGMTGEELDRWFFEVYRKVKELEARIAALETPAS